MRIGIMLRHLGERGGITMFTRHVLDELLKQDRDDDFLLLVRSTQDAATAEQWAAPHVQIRLVPASTKLGWDQVAVPWLARQERLDLLFNPKLSVPFLTRCRTIFTLHGAEQFAHPELFPLLDRLYVRTFMPLYCVKADAVLCFAEAVKRDLVAIGGIDPAKLLVVPQAPHPRFRRVTDPAGLAAVRAKYRLPEHFLFFISGITPLKNLPRIFQAYAQIKDRIPHRLVMAGFGRWRYESDVHLIDTLGLGDRVIKLGYLPDEEVPVFMSLADALVFPSLYEGLGIPILEAQACGCPVLTSTRGAAPETSGGAALLVDPFSVDEIADAMERIATDRALRAELSERGLAEARHRSWQATARKLSEIFQAVGA